MKTVAFVTGSNRGLGRQLVDQLLARGAKVYAASRTGEAHPGAIAVKLDVTKPDEIAAAARLATDTTLLVNNAGTLASASVLTADHAAIEQDLGVNFFGVLDVVRAFVPNLPRGAAIANVLSVVSMASMPGIGGYSASKAAAWSLTQSLRGELRARDIRVHAVFPGPIDTDMTKAMTMPKTSPEEVARAILEGIFAGVDDIAPDPMSREVYGTFVADPRAVERQFGA